MVPAKMVQQPLIIESWQATAAQMMGNRIPHLLRLGLEIGSLSSVIRPPQLYHVGE